MRLSPERFTIKCNWMRNKKQIGDATVMRKGFIAMANDIQNVFIFESESPYDDNKTDKTTHHCFIIDLMSKYHEDKDSEPELLEKLNQFLEENFDRNGSSWEAKMFDIYDYYMACDDYMASKDDYVASK